MKRTFKEASLRGCNKFILSGISLKHLNKNLLTYEELKNITIIEFILESLLEKFDKNTAQLGFNVLRYDIKINDTNWSRNIEFENNVSNSRIKWLKKQNIKFTILKQYNLKDDI